MLNGPRVYRQPLRPVPIGKNGELASQSVSAPFDLRAFYSHEAGLDGMDLHGDVSFSSTVDGRRDINGDSPDVSRTGVNSIRFDAVLKNCIFYISLMI
jgi:hypothetical protein